MVTLEEEIERWEKQVSMLNPILYSKLIDDHMQLINWLKDYKRLLVREPKTDYKSFAEWVASEIFSDEWECNKDGFEEIACRKLSKLGLVKADGDKWVRMERSDEKLKKQWIVEAEKNAKDLAERIYEQIAEEADYADVDRKWYFERVIKYMRVESEG